MKQITLTIDVSERHLEILRKRQNGQTYKTIGREHDITPERAKHIVDAVIARLVRQLLEETNVA